MAYGEAVTFPTLFCQTGKKPRKNTAHKPYRLPSVREKTTGREVIEYFQKENNFLSLQQTLVKNSTRASLPSPPF